MNWGFPEGMFYKVLTLWAVLALPAFAQTQDYPPRPTQPVTDMADLLPDAAEARLTTAINALRDETGIELLLITLETRTPYAEAPTMEAFVTNLFNTWGIGDAARNDGILIYVARTDREMRIELGSGFGTEWDHVAQEVINSNFLPFFRNDSYADGVERGTNATIRDIALPFAAGQPASEPGFDYEKVVFGLFVAMATFLKFRQNPMLQQNSMLRQKLGDFGTSMKRCPNCGRRGLHRSRKVIYIATATSEGHGESSTRCTHCDYREVTPYRIRRRTSRSSSSGGGRSSGGGASGRW